MKAPLKFISLYYVCCLIIVILIKVLFNFFSTEIFSYLLWFYIEGLVLGVILYPAIKMLVERLSIGHAVKIVIDGLICLILINLVSLISDHRLLTIDLIRNIKNGIGLHDNNLLIHFVSLFCFVLITWLVNRNQRK